MVNDAQDIKCRSRVLIEELGIFWCKKYKTIIPLDNRICIGCLVSESVREDLRIRAEKFDECQTRAMSNNYCDIFEIETDQYKCGLCQGSILIRARLSMTAMKNKRFSASAQVQEEHNNKMEKIWNSFKIVRRLLYSPERGQISILERAISSFDQKRKDIFSELDNA